MEKRIRDFITASGLTARMASRAERARMSAQDTTPGHIASILAFTSSMISNPRIENLLPVASFSPRPPLGLFSKTEASQP